jgi:hypothetical protein
VPQHDLSLDVARTALGEPAFALAWERGIHMDLVAAIAFAGGSS